VLGIFFNRIGQPTIQITTILSVDGYPADLSIRSRPAGLSIRSRPTVLSIRGRPGAQGCQPQHQADSPEASHESCLTVGPSRLRAKKRLSAGATLYSHLVIIPSANQKLKTRMPRAALTTLLAMTATRIILLLLRDP